MNTEDKILALLEHMQEEQKLMRDDISGVKDDLAGVKDDLAGVKDDLAGVKDDLVGVKGEVVGMKDDITGIKLRLELDVEKRFDAMNDSIDAISKKLDTLDEVKALAEETKDRVDVIHAVVTQHSTAITELKRVQ